MPVPEASVHEDNGSVFREHYIGGSRKLLVVQTVVEFVRMEELSDGDLRLGVFAAYFRHIGGALFRCQFVGHSKLRHCNVFWSIRARDRSEQPGPERARRAREDRTARGEPGGGPLDERRRVGGLQERSADAPSAPHKTCNVVEMGVGADQYASGFQCRCRNP